MDRYCLSCLALLVGLKPGQPPLCAGCWPKLSVQEKTFLLHGEESRVLLRAILSQLQGNSETENLERAADKIERHAKRQADAIAEFILWLKARAEEGGESWRG